MTAAPLLTRDLPGPYRGRVELRRTAVQALPFEVWWIPLSNRQRPLQLSAREHSRAALADFRWAARKLGLARA